MPRTVWELLCQALEDLNDAQYKMFTNKLVDLREEPRVRRSAVEGKDRGDLANILIGKFTEQRAVTITVDVLKKIDCNQTAKELEQEAADLAAVSQTPLTQPVQVTQSTQPTQPTQLTQPTQSTTEADFIDKNWTFLVQRATGMGPILDTLLSMKVIMSEQYYEIRARTTPQDQMRALITGPINSSGQSGKLVLYQVLKKEQPYMMMDLGAL